MAEQSATPYGPLFPGVLMVEAAAQMCTYDFMHRGTAATSAWSKATAPARSMPRRS